jgi:putative hydrolase of the HAD superfamily
MIKWVVFDLGDVVLQHTNALAELGELLLAEPEPFTAAYFEHRPDYDRRSDAHVFWTSIAATTGTTAPEPDLIDELVRRDDLGWSAVDPDTLQLIDDLAASDTSLAVLSNAPSSMGRLVEVQPWAAAFDQLFFSGDLGLVKPDQDIYRHLLDNLGAEPTEVAFLDDRADNIAGAKALGIHGFVFTNAAQARLDLRGIGLALNA